MSLTPEQVRQIAHSVAHKAFEVDEDSDISYEIQEQLDNKLIASEDLLSALEDAISAVIPVREA